MDVAPKMLFSYGGLQMMSSCSVGAAHPEIPFEEGLEAKCCSCSFSILELATRMSSM